MKVVEPCEDCGSTANVCPECGICVPCSGDGHDEGCPREGDEYTAEKLAEIETITANHTTSTMDSKDNA